MEFAHRSIDTIIEGHEEIRIIGDCLDLSHKNLTSIKDLTLLATAIKNQTYFQFLQGDISSLRAIDCSYNALKTCNISIIKDAFPLVQEINISYNPLKKVNLRGLSFGNTLILELKRPTININLEALLHLEPINIHLSKKSLSRQQFVSIITINKLLRHKNLEMYNRAIATQTTIFFLLTTSFYTAAYYYRQSSDLLFATTGTLISSTLPTVFHILRSYKINGIIRKIYGFAYPSTDRYAGHNIIITD